MGITRSPLPQNIGNLPLPCFVGKYPIVLMDNIINDFVCKFNQFTWIIFFHYHIYSMQKIRGNENSPNSLNLMVNYHFLGENRVIPGNSRLCFRVQLNHPSPNVDCFVSYKVSISAFCFIFYLLSNNSKETAIKFKRISVCIEILNHLPNFLNRNISENVNFKTHNSFFVVHNGWRGVAQERYRVQYGQMENGPWR